MTEKWDLDFGLKNGSGNCRTSWRAHTRSFCGCEFLVQMAVPCDVRSQMHHDKARSRHEMSMTDTACGLHFISEKQ